MTSSFVAPPSQRHFSGPARCRRYGSSSLYYAILTRVTSSYLIRAQRCDCPHLPEHLQPVCLTMFRTANQEGRVTNQLIAGQIQGQALICPHPVSTHFQPSHDYPMDNSYLPFRYFPPR